MPHYWSELILLAEQLLLPEERAELHEMIFKIEMNLFKSFLSLKIPTKSAKKINK